MYVNRCSSGESAHLGIMYPSDKKIKIVINYVVESRKFKVLGTRDFFFELSVILTIGR